ncbi:MAG: cytochrome c biogenesis protein CcdA [Planctomycetota bacterium]
MTGRISRLLFAAFLVTVFLAGQDLPFAAPVTVEAVLPPPSSAGVPIEFHFTIRPGVHVYTAASQFFEVHAGESAGLGVVDLQLPAVGTLANFDGSTSTVLEGENPVVMAVWPYAAAASTAWRLKGHLQYQACSGTTCFPPATVPFEASGTVPAGITAAAPVPSPAFSETPFWQKGLIWGILGAFLAGLGLSLTPCVYPMIGITVAIIAGSGASRRRRLWLTFIYVLGLAVVYALAGLAVAAAGSTMAAFFRSPWVLVPIGLVFIALGLSSFDLFNLQTPSGFSAWAQAVGRKLKGSTGGTFLMGAISAFVVGPCVSGPVLGLISFVAASGDHVLGFALFFALAWGMGAILFVAGSAAGVLPKAGPWMERIKHVIGVILLWAAFYFTRPVIGETAYLAASFTAAAFGLVAAGLLRIPGPGAHKRAWAALLVGLVLLSGFSAYMVHTVRGEEPAAVTVVDLDQVLNGTTKPVLLDFTAPWCVNCREIDATVLSQPEVRAQLARYTFIKVDYDSNPDLARRFNIIGPPAFVFLDRTGAPDGKTIVTGGELRKRILAP